MGKSRVDKIIGTHLGHGRNAAIVKQIVTRIGLETFPVQSVGQSTTHWKEVPRHARIVVSSYDVCT